MIPSRHPDGLELRRVAELRTAGRRLEGYAALFGVEARIGDFRETIRPGAFRASLLAQSDVLALVDHDPGRLLARTASGTLRLDEDWHGLAYSLDVPDTSLGRDVLALAQRGDIGGMSFGFRVIDENWPARDQRELRAVELIEVSIVHSWPAYPDTTVTARSRDAALAALRRRRMLDMI